MNDNDNSAFKSWRHLSARDSLSWPAWTNSRRNCAPNWTRSARPIRTQKANCGPRSLRGRRNDPARQSRPFDPEVRERLELRGQDARFGRLPARAAADRARKSPGAELPSLRIGVQACRPWVTCRLRSLASTAPALVEVRADRGQRCQPATGAGCHARTDSAVRVRAVGSRRCLGIDDAVCRHAVSVFRNPDD